MTDDDLSSPPGGPRSPAGPIALLGSGEFLDGMTELDRRLLAGRPPRVVHLPTAAGAESHRRLQYWRDLAAEHFTGRLGVEVETLDVLDRASADDPALASRLEGAGLVYLSGGNPGYLAAALRGSAVLDAIRRVHAAGAALAGCSAGACALTGYAPDVRSLGGDGHGLELLPGVAVFPHHGASLWHRRLASHMAKSVPEGMKILGIAEDTAAVTSDGRHFEVYGQGAVTVLPDTVFHDGDAFDL